MTRDFMSFVRICGAFSHHNRSCHTREAVRQPETTNAKIHKKKLEGKIIVDGEKWGIIIFEMVCRFA